MSFEGLTIALCGDVMTGRGIDQILPYPSEPTLHESYVQSAEGYVRLAEVKNGPIPRAVDPSYIWGDAIRDLDERRPDARVINLETSITLSDHWEEKGINYRMSPRNIACLTAAKIDCCSLANNHVLDWGRQGLLETLQSLHGAGISYVGAGKEESEAERPVVLDRGERGRILVIAAGNPSSGIPLSWAATKRHPGVNVVQDLSAQGVEKFKRRIHAVKRPKDVVIASIHWGENWGYEIPNGQVAFAHALVDHAGVDVVHGHSSHHAKGFEIYHGKLILYGCGDFINDYEGIEGYESFRADLSVLYFVQVEAHTGQLLSLEMRPYVMKFFSLHRADSSDVRWLRDVMERNQRGTRVPIGVRGNSLVLAN